MHDYRLECRGAVFRHRLNYCEIAGEMGITLRELLAMMRAPLDEKGAKKILSAIDRLTEEGE